MELRCGPLRVGTAAAYINQSITSPTTRKPAPKCVPPTACYVAPMLEWSAGTRFLRGSLACAGLGLLAGGLEMVGQAATLALPLGFLSFLLLGVLNILAMGLVGLGCGVLAGGIQWLSRTALGSRLLALQTAVGGGMLCAWYLWAAALVLRSDGRIAGALIMAVMPVAFSAVVYYNAAYWFRKVELGREFRVGWTPIAAGVALLVAVGAAAGHAARDTGGRGALEGDANVVLITVDGLRHDEVFGADAVLADLAAESVRFREVVSPMPESLAANTTVLTSLHPLRHGVLTEGDALRPGFRTLAEVLESEGWATGAFVSSSALGARTGLAQGFRVYDDALAGAVSGIERLTLFHRLGWGRGEQRREASVTTDRFLGWYGRHRAVPFFAWVHLQDPSGADHAAGVKAAADAVDRITGALESDGLADATLVVVASTHGWLLGEHDAHGNRGLWDVLVRVPVLVRAPGVEPKTWDVDTQVRLMDIAPAVLRYLRLDPLEPSEGVDMLDYAKGLRRVPMWCSLVGQGGDDLFATILLGMRNNGLKYIREVRTGKERLYDLNADPEEMENLAPTHQSTLEKAREMVAAEETALRGLLLEAHR